MSSRMSSSEGHSVWLGILKIGPSLLLLAGLIACRYFQSLARQADATGQDSIDQELDMFQFSSKAPTERLGHPVAGGVTELGFEVNPITVPTLHSSSSLSASHRYRSERSDDQFIFKLRSL